MECTRGLLYLEMVFCKALRSKKLGGRYEDPDYRSDRLAYAVAIHGINGYYGGRRSCDISVGHSLVGWASICDAAVVEFWRGDSGGFPTQIG
jgi:hypothetical protein